MIVGAWAGCNFVYPAATTLGTCFAFFMSHIPCPLNPSSPSKRTCPGPFIFACAVVFCHHIPLPTLTLCQTPPSHPSRLTHHSDSHLPPSPPHAAFSQRATRSFSLFILRPHPHSLHSYTRTLMIYENSTRTDCCCCVLTSHSPQPFKCPKVPKRLWTGVGLRRGSQGAGIGSAEVCPKFVVEHAHEGSTKGLTGAEQPSRRDLCAARMDPNGLPEPNSARAEQGGPAAVYHRVLP